jgi:spore coat polysaccharide biosynthesis protein SpsF
MSYVIGVITARMASTRLPGKVLMDLAGKSIFAHHVERMQEVSGLDQIYLATSVDPQNEPLIREAESMGCGWYAGPEEDIVERHVRICERESADAVIRVTCDCPLFNTGITSRFIESFRKEYADFIYCGNMTMMQGTLPELISCKALIRIHESYHGPAVSLPIRENPSAFSLRTLDVETNFIRPEYRLTVDEMRDYMLLDYIYKALYRGHPIPLSEVYRWLDDNPEIARINRSVPVKGVNTYIANLMDKPVYSVVKSGKKYVILDENRQVVSLSVFLKRIKKMAESHDLV